MKNIEIYKAKVYGIIVTFVVMQTITYAAEQMRHKMCYSIGFYGFFNALISGGSPLCNMLERVSYASVQYNSNILNSILVYAH